MRKILIIISICLNSAFFLNAQETDSYILKATALIDAGKTDMAIDECLRGLAVKDDYRLLQILGEAWMEKGNNTKAEEAFSRASGLREGAGSFGLAKLYALSGQVKKAIDQLRFHLKSDFKLPGKELLLEPAFKGLSNTGEWKELWSAGWYTRLEEGKAEASYLISNKRIDELAALLDYLKPMYEGSSDLFYINALYLNASGKKKEASHLFKKAVDLDKSDPIKWKALVNAWLDEGLYFEAAVLSAEALKLHPGERSFILTGASALRKAGDRPAALKEVQKYLELVPEDEEGLIIAGDIEYEMKAYTDALKYYSRSIGLFPGNPDNYIRRANTYSVTSTWEFAVSDYAMALDLKPDDANAWYGKGVALLKMGDRDSACRSLRMAHKYGNSKAASLINLNCIR
ncbi:MAG: tetratricopeptide repeat protein [Marinilabiliaceae bacterium]|jgi:tetratricopeptide (TPR) repeat protein|nr:tetratricopeptide repeat protein [Marinilabiliaceae bacterium]